jgi:hypothetical protein
MGIFPLVVRRSLLRAWLQCGQGAEVPSIQLELLAKKSPADPD